MAQVAIGLAISVATSLLMASLTPPVKQEGSKLSSLDPPSSEYGRSIPKIYGTSRVNGNLIWARNLREQKNEESSGGKGFGSTTTTTTYSYFGTFAILLCEGEVELGKVWVGGKLIYNPSARESQTQAANGRLNQYITFYNGSDSQQPNSTIQAKEDVENTPAFRGKAYLVFDDLPLEDFGNVIPPVSAEIRSEITRLEDVVKDICKGAGINPDLVEAEELDDEIRGLQIPQDGESYREALESLQKAYFFFGYQLGNKLVFRKYERPKITANLPDLAAHQFGSERPDDFKEIRVPPEELPAKLSLSYLNPNKELQLDSLSIERQRYLNNNEISIASKITFEAGQAKTIAYKLLSQIWIRRRKFEDIVLPPSWAGVLSPGELIAVPVTDSAAVVIQITRIEIGANLLVKIKGVFYGIDDVRARSYDIDIPTSTSISQPNYTIIEKERDTEITFPSLYGAASNIILDIPIINSLYSNPYAVWVSVVPPVSDWRNGVIYVAQGSGSYTPFVPAPFAGTNGRVTSLIPPSRTDLIDKATTITVELDGGQLSSVPEESFYRLEVFGIFGDEIIAWRDTTLIAPNTYELSYLIRGAKGTNYFVDKHSVGERFVLLQGTGANLNFIGNNSSSLYQTFNFKTITDASQLGSTTPDLITYHGNALKPYSPSHLKYKKLSNGDFLISWRPRNRIEGSIRDAQGANLSDQPVYDLLFYDSGQNLVATHHVDNFGAHTFTYTTSLQIVDYGSEQTELNLSVSQVSNVVGQGFPGFNLI